MESPARVIALSKPRAVRRVSRVVTNAATRQHGGSPALCRDAATPLRRLKCQRTATGARFGPNAWHSRREALHIFSGRAMAKTACMVSQGRLFSSDILSRYFFPIITDIWSGLLRGSCSVFEVGGLRPPPSPPQGLRRAGDLRWTGWRGREFHPCQGRKCREKPIGEVTELS